MEKRYNAGLYLRLSLEDAVSAVKQGGRTKGNPFQTESVSIENQRAILSEYVALRGWNVAGSYVDDGYSGGNFARPAFQRMLEDAEAGLIDLILVKDLSRLGRDYLDVGKYTEEVFPMLGVRFIALMDGIDSEGSMDILPFRSILNDYHLKDLSRKIKSTLRAKAENGTYIGSYAPFGYEKDPNNPGRLVVDEPAAEVVRRIFELRLQMIGMSKIAGILNRDGVKCPAVYRDEKVGRAREYRRGGVWQFQTVKLILRNEAYIGHSVKFRKGAVSYKNGKIVDRPKEDWIRVENTHEPVIGRETWDAAQAVNLQRYDSSPVPAAARKPSLFSGLLVCADCGGGFNRSNWSGTTKNTLGKKYGYYNCSMFKQSGQAHCCNHSISELALLTIVREDVRRHLERIGSDGNATERAAAELGKRMSSLSDGRAKEKLAMLDKRLAELDALFAKLYEDRLSGAVSPETYKSLAADAEAERETLAKERGCLMSEIEKSQKSACGVEQWVSLLRSYMEFENPDYEAVHSLVERIEIGRREGAGKRKRQNIKIIYRFVGAIKQEVN
ncbi:MAG: recombinase family protein [Synergistaceae bacterium]|jgi:DNA invertase Pin-like site-specific DNA recombinase|nr:recombinase family protein [Synergistaceae bacterium]